MMTAIFILFVVFVSCIGQEIELDCVVSCECQDETAYCADMAFKTWPYHPMHIFSAIRFLDLSKNLINHLPTVDIRKNFPNLEIIDLRGNDFPCHAVHYLEKSATVISDCEIPTTDSPKVCPPSTCGRQAIQKSLDFPELPDFPPTIASPIESPSRDYSVEDLLSTFSPFGTAPVRIVIPKDAPDIVKARLGQGTVITELPTMGTTSTTTPRTLISPFTLEDKRTVWRRGDHPSARLYVIEGVRGAQGCGCGNFSSMSCTERTCLTYEFNVRA